ncbi:MAG: DUF2304 domain-containing protein [Candidatus Magasanikbacteria bacterium]
MMIIQIILVVFFLFVLFKVLGRFRSGELKGKETIGWIIFWILAIVVVISPNSTTVLAKLLGVGRGVDAVIYLAIALLFFLIFKIFIRLEKIDHQITKIVRQDTLNQAKKYESTPRHS